MPVPPQLSNGGAALRGASGGGGGRPMVPAERPPPPRLTGSGDLRGAGEEAANDLAVVLRSEQVPLVAVRAERCRILVPY